MTLPTLDEATTKFAAADALVVKLTEKKDVAGNLMRMRRENFNKALDRYEAISADFDEAVHNLRFWEDAVHFARESEASK